MKLCKLRFMLAAFAATLVCLSWTNTGQASLVEIGSASVAGSVPAFPSDTLSATATFYYDTAAPKTLIIDLVNTTNLGGKGTAESAEVLTGLAFNISGSPTYASTPTAHNLSPSLTLTGNGTTSTTLPAGDTDADFASSWTNKIGSSPLSGVAYGISTTGFHGAFVGNGIGAEDHGIVGPGTLTTNDGLHAHLPLAVNGLEFKLPFTTNISGSKLSNVEFLFGSGGDGILVSHPVPEPSTLAIAGLGGLGFLGVCLRRRPR